MQYGIMGDITGAELPQMKIEESSLSEERKMAKYSRSTEFKRIQDHFNERIDFYQKFLPNGADIGLDVVPTPEDWRVANRVIGEFKAIINMFETANQAVKDSLE